MSSFQIVKVDLAIFVPFSQFEVFLPDRTAGKATLIGVARVMPEE